MTIGKPGFSHIYRHRTYSFFEILNRCSSVSMNVNFTDLVGCLKLSSLYHDLDPSEKGMISYQLGMMVTKLCAHELLDTPWLVHLSWMEKQNRIKYPAQNRYKADLLGLSRITKRWSLYEAKGRSGVFSQNVLDGAKQQSQMSIMVDGQPKDLGVACGLFTRNYFDFHWQDPPEDDEEALQLKTTRKTWLAYYSNVNALFGFQTRHPDMLKSLIGFSIDIRPEVLEFIHILENSDDESWREFTPKFTDTIQKTEGDLENYLFSGMDGITIKLTEEMIE